MTVGRGKLHKWSHFEQSWSCHPAGTALHTFLLKPLEHLNRAKPPLHWAKAALFPNYLQSQQESRRSDDGLKIKDIL